MPIDSYEDKEFLRNELLKEMGYEYWETVFGSAYPGKPTVVGRVKRIPEKRRDNTKPKEKVYIHPISLKKNMEQNDLFGLNVSELVKPGDYNDGCVVVCEIWLDRMKRSPDRRFFNADNLKEIPEDILEVGWEKICLELKKEELAEVEKGFQEIEETKRKINAESEKRILEIVEESNRLDAEILELTKKNKEKEDELLKKEEELKRLTEKKEEDFKRLIERYEDTVSGMKVSYLAFLKPYLKGIAETELSKDFDINRFAAESCPFSDFQGLIDHVQGYVWYRGRHFDRDSRIVEQFLGAIGSGQIILLAGAPGTGKTSLARLVGDATGAETRYIVVQPNWTDSQDLLGYYNSKDKEYIHTAFFDALLEAEKSPEKMFFIILDEMNLAHIEYYFSVLLSVMERNGDIPLISDTERAELRAAGNDSFPEKLSIPDNVQFVGTVNMDELSKNISPKVIDRSFIIELPNGCTGKQRPDIYPPEDISPVCVPVDFYKNVQKDREKVEKDLEVIQELYDGVNDFFQDNRSDIFGAPVRFSHRCKKRAEYMLMRGATIDDIIMGRLLPCINWEMPGDIYDEFKESLLREDGIISDVERVADKLDSMKDMYEDRIMMDYWLSSRR